MRICRSYIIIIRSSVVIFSGAIFLVYWFLAPIEASEPVIIASIFSETGIAVGENLPAVKGVKIAVDEINRNGGLLEHPLKLISFDNNSTPIGSKYAAEKAVKNRVKGVIGAIWSSHSIAIAKTLQKSRIPMISPGSTKPNVTNIGNYIFRACYTDSFQGKVLGRFAFNDIGARTAIVLDNISEEYCQTLAEYFIEYFTNSGGQILWRGHYKGTAVDFSDMLLKVKKYSPDIIFIPGYSRDSGLIIKQAVKMEISATYMGGDAWAGPITKYAGLSLEGSYFSNHWHPDVPFEGNRKYQDAYKKIYGDEKISAISVLAYDSVMLFADSVRRAGSADCKKIRNALSQTNNYQGVTGYYTFNENGDPIHKAASILKFENGSWRFVKMVGQ